MYFRNEGNPQTKLVNKLLHSLGKRMGGLSRLESIIKDQLKANNIVFDLKKKIKNGFFYKLILTTVYMYNKVL